jgi:hypothetical protein
MECCNRIFLYMCGLGFHLQVVVVGGTGTVYMEPRAMVCYDNEQLFLSSQHGWGFRKPPPWLQIGHHNLILRALEKRRRE